MPAADTLVDMFCGGCSITHAALLSDKWSHVIANDIHADVPKLFIDAVKGKYTLENERRWISREDFFALKDTDAYVRLCWSFGNDCETYLYGKDVEPVKKLVHEFVTGATVKDRMVAWKKFVSKYLFGEADKYKCLSRGPENLERLQRLQNLENLERLRRLQIDGKDYRQVTPPPDSIIYCDIPYKATKTNYDTPFDREAFFLWAVQQEQPIVISEYNIEDERFAVLAETTKKQLSANGAHQKDVTERLYVPKHQYEHIVSLLKQQRGET